MSRNRLIKSCHLLLVPRKREWQLKGRKSRKVRNIADKECFRKTENRLTSDKTASIIKKAKKVLVRQKRDFGLLLVPLYAEIVSLATEGDGAVVRNKAKPSPASEIVIDPLQRKHLCFEVKSVMTA